MKDLLFTLSRMYDTMIGIRGSKVQGGGGDLKCYHIKSIERW